MGFGGISIWQLLIVLAIVILLFGTKKLKGIGTDLGGAIKGFKKALNNEDKKSDADNKSITESDEETKASANVSKESVEVTKEKP